MIKCCDAERPWLCMKARSFRDSCCIQVSHEYTWILNTGLLPFEYCCFSFTSIIWSLFEIGCICGGVVVFRVCSEALEWFVFLENNTKENHTGFIPTAWAPNSIYDLKAVLNSLSVLVLFVKMVQGSRSWVGGLCFSSSQVKGAWDWLGFVMASQAWLESSLRRSASLGLEVLERASRRSVDWTSTSTSHSPTTTDEDTQRPIKVVHVFCVTCPPSWSELLSYFLFIASHLCSFSLHRCTLVIFSEEPHKTWLCLWDHSRLHGTDNLSVQGQRLIICLASENACTPGYLAYVELE